MKLNLYGVLDEKAEAFRWFQFLMSNGVAIRNFADSVKDPKSALNQHPADYSIYLLGSVDDNSGQVVPLVPIQFLSRGSEYVNGVAVSNNGGEK